MAAATYGEIDNDFRNRLTILADTVRESRASIDAQIKGVSENVQEETKKIADRVEVLSGLIKSAGEVVRAKSGALERATGAAANEVNEFTSRISTAGSELVKVSMTADSLQKKFGESVDNLSNLLNVLSQLPSEIRKSVGEVGHKAAELDSELTDKIKNLLGDLNAIDEIITEVTKLLAAKLEKEIEAWSTARPS